MAGSHFSGPVIETSLRNSQDTARAQTVRNLVRFVGVNDTTYTPDTEAVTLTRTAAGNYHYLRTAAAGARTDLIWFQVPMLSAADTADSTRGEVARGARITGFSLLYKVDVVALTSLTPTLQYTVGADAAAIAITSHAVTPTAAAAGDIADSDPNFQVPVFTVTTPTVVTSTDSVSIDITVVLANTGVLDYYGAFINYDLLL